MAEAERADFGLMPRTDERCMASLNLFPAELMHAETCPMPPRASKSSTATPKVEVEK
ncbi:hypothetical protein AB4Y38_07565 [Paraburkholderia sp. EG285A]|uniref:hypothetical protein n=1 Tax=Paraburkholderia sp. EG285A TaxID=3237009 RepID=UPI0034D16F15